MEVAGVTSIPGELNSGPANSSPGPLLYGGAAALGLVVVLGGGWLYLRRPWER
jgi:hypothetical protein